MEPEATGERPSALPQARPPRFPAALAGLTAREVHSQPAKKGECQGAPSLKERKGKKMPPYRGLWNWGNSTTRAPRKVLPEGLQSRLPREELPGRSNIIPTLILSLNRTYIVTSLLGISYLPNWIWSCWRVSRALCVLWNKPWDPAQSDKIRSCSIIICTGEPTLSILEQMSLHVLPLSLFSMRD